MVGFRIIIAYDGNKNKQHIFTFGFLFHPTTLYLRPSSYVIRVISLSPLFSCLSRLFSSISTHVWTWILHLLYFFNWLHIWLKLYITNVQWFISNIRFKYYMSLNKPTFVMYECWHTLSISLRIRFSVQCQTFRNNYWHCKGLTR